MRAFRERPRVVVAQVVGILLLVAVGVVIGSALTGGDESPERATDAQLQDARTELRFLESELRERNREDRLQREVIQRYERRLRGAVRLIRRLERQVTRTRRALRRARR